MFEQRVIHNESIVITLTKQTKTPGKTELLAEA